MNIFFISKAIILILLFSVFTFAQDELTHGVSVYLFNGYAAGYRFGEDAHHFWRINIDINTNYQDDYIDSYEAGTDTLSHEYKSDLNTVDISISPQYIFKLYQNKFIDLYSGGGFRIGYNRNEDKSEGGQPNLNKGY